VLHLQTISSWVVISTLQIKKRRKSYALAVGSLMYVMACTRSNIAHAVGVMSIFHSNPDKDHWTIVKWILKYLRGISTLCLCYENAKPKLSDYLDADYVSNIDSRKSTSGYIMIFAEGTVLWQSRLQKCITLSTMEDEYSAII